MADLQIHVGDTLPAVGGVEVSWLQLVIQWLWQQGCSCRGRYLREKEERRNKEALAALRGRSYFFVFYSWGFSAVSGSTRLKDRKGQVERGIQQGEEADPVLNWTVFAEQKVYNWQGRQEQSRGAQLTLKSKGDQEGAKLHGLEWEEGAEVRGSGGGGMLLVLCTCLAWAGEDHSACGQI